MEVHQCFLKDVWGARLKKVFHFPPLLLNAFKNCTHAQKRKKLHTTDIYIVFYIQGTKIFVLI